MISHIHSYEKAETRLQKIEQEDELTVDYVRSILDVIHYEGFETNTAYSQIFDLKNGMAYLYYWHQFGEVVTLNLTEELAKGEHKVTLQDLFPQEALDAASHEYQTYQAFVVGITAIISVASVTLVLFLGFLIRKTVKSSDFTIKWKVLRIIACIIGGVIIFSFFMNIYELFPYFLAGNYLSNSDRIQTLFQQFVTSYLILGVCAAAISLGYLSIRRKTIS